MAHRHLALRSMVVVALLTALAPTGFAQSDWGSTKPTPTPKPGSGGGDWGSPTPTPTSGSGDWGNGGTAGDWGWKQKKDWGDDNFKTKGDWGQATSNYGELVKRDDWGTEEDRLATLANYAASLLYGGVDAYWRGDSSRAIEQLSQAEYWMLKDLYPNYSVDSFRSGPLGLSSWSSGRDWADGLTGYRLQSAAMYRRWGAADLERKLNLAHYFLGMSHLRAGNRGAAVAFLAAVVRTWSDWGSQFERSNSGLDGAALWHEQLTMYAETQLALAELLDDESGDGAREALKSYQAAHKELRRIRSDGWPPALVLGEVRSGYYGRRQDWYGGDRSLAASLERCERGLLALLERQVQGSGGQNDEVLRAAEYLLGNAQSAEVKQRASLVKPSAMGARGNWQGAYDAHMSLREQYRQVWDEHTLGAGDVANGRLDRDEVAVDRYREAQDRGQSQATKDRGEQGVVSVAQEAVSEGNYQRAFDTYLEQGRRYGNDGHVLTAADLARERMSNGQKALELYVGMLDRASTADLRGRAEAGVVAVADDSVKRGNAREAYRILRTTGREHGRDALTLLAANLARTTLRDPAEALVVYQELLDPRKERDIVEKAEGGVSAIADEHVNAGRAAEAQKLLLDVGRAKKREELVLQAATITRTELKDPAGALVIYKELYRSTSDSIKGRVDDGVLALAEARVAAQDAKGAYDLLLATGKAHGRDRLVLQAADCARTRLGDATGALALYKELLGRNKYGAVREGAQRGVLAALEPGITAAAPAAAVDQVVKAVCGYGLDGDVRTTFIQLGASKVDAMVGKGQLDAALLALDALGKLGASPVDLALADKRVVIFKKQVDGGDGAAVAKLTRAVLDFDGRFGGSNRASSVANLKLLLGVLEAKKLDAATVTQLYNKLAAYGDKAGLDRHSTLAAQRLTEIAAMSAAQARAALLQMWAAPSADYAKAEAERAKARDLYLAQFSSPWYKAARKLVERYPAVAGPAAGEKLKKKDREAKEQAARLANDLRARCVALRDEVDRRELAQYGLYPGAQLEALFAAGSAANRAFDAHVQALTVAWPAAVVADQDKPMTDLFSGGKRKKAEQALAAATKAVDDTRTAFLAAAYPGAAASAPTRAPARAEGGLSLEGLEQR